LPRPYDANGTPLQRYTPLMNLTLDPPTEQRIQRELARGPYREPSELINHALDLFDAQEDWLLRNRDAITIYAVLHSRSRSPPYLTQATLTPAPVSPPHRPAPPPAA